MKTICKLNHEIFDYILLNPNKVELLYRNSIFYIKNMDIKDILRIDDIYIRLYLLIHNDIQQYEPDEKDINSIVEALRNVNTIFFDVQISKNMLFLCKNKFKNLSIEAYIKILSSIKLQKDDIKYYRKFFGYSVIYKKYKKMVENIYSDNFTLKELGLVMTLLNNEKLCYNRLLDTFVRLNEYIENNILDKNLISCCTVLRSLLIYVPTSLDDKEELLYGLMVYLTNILSKSSNFKFFNLEDTFVLVNTIKDICRTLNLDFKYRKVAFGLLRECKEKILNIISSNTNIYEEIVSLIALLDCLGYFVELIYSKKEDKEIKKIEITSRCQKYLCEMDDLYHETEEEDTKEESSAEKEDNDTFEIDFLNKIDTKMRLLLDNILNDNLFRIIEGYKLPDSFCLGYNELSEIKKRFYKSKYRTLDTISKILDIEVDRVFFFNDLYNVEHPEYILKEINYIKRNVSWADLIILSCNSSLPGEYIDILFSETYIGNYDHLSYIYLFINSLKNDFDAVLYTSIRLTYLYNYIDCERYWEILVILYLKYIDEEDIRVQKSRLYIANKILNLKNNDILNNVLKFTLKNIEVDDTDEEVDNKDYNEDKKEKYKDHIHENNNLVSFLYILVYNITEIRKEMFEKLFLFLMISSKSFKEVKVHLNSKFNFLKDSKTRNQDLFSKAGIYIPQIKTNNKLSSKQMIYVSLGIKLLLIYKPNLVMLESFKDKDNFYFYVSMLIYFNIQNSSMEYFNSLKLMLFDLIFSLSRHKQKELAKLLNYGKLKITKSGFYKNYIFMDNLFSKTFK